MKKNIKKNNYIILALFIFVSFFRVWLLYSNNWYINAETYYDSHLEINSVVNILAGNWMGSYNKFVLCKNPTYPIFLALLFILHIPYTYGIGLLMILSCLLFIKSIKPLVNNRLVLFFIYCFLLYNPVCREVAYHYRNALQPWLILMTVSCIIGMYLRRNNNKLSELLPYSVIGMISMGAFWLLREDSIWFLPFALVAYLIGVISLVIDKEEKKKIIKFAILSFLPIFGIILSVNLISAINYKTYGIYATNDRMQTNTAKLLGRLILIDDGSSLENDQWVSSETIELAKEVSPTFASFDLHPFDQWSKKGDHSIWAIRDVLANSGYFVDAKETNKICGKVIKELDEGFKDGRLKKKKGIKLSDTSGVFSMNEMLKSSIQALDVVKYHFDYDALDNGFTSIINYSSEEDLLLYEEVLGINLFRNESRINNTHVNAFTSDIMYKIQNENHLRSLYHNKTIMDIILFIYQRIDVVLIVLSTVGFIFIVYKMIKKDKSIKYKFESFIMMIGLLAITYVNAYLVCIFSTSFDSVTVNDILYNYTTVEYLLIALYEIIGIIYFGIFINNILKNKTGKNKQLKDFVKTLRKKDLHKIFKEKTNNTYLQFFRYFFVGGFAAVVNIGMLYVLTDIFHLYYILSNVLSFSLGLFVNYLLSKKFVFQEKTKLSRFKEFIIYAIIGVLGLGLDTLIIWLITDVIGIYYMISKIISTGIVFVWNFGARKILYKIIK